MSLHSLRQKEWEEDMDILSLLFSELHLTPWHGYDYETKNLTSLSNINKNKKDNTCVVCSNPTNNIVHDICEKNCKYLCHEDCLNSWITYKGYGVFCMMCGSSQNYDYITNIFNKSKFFLHN